MSTGAKKRRCQQCGHVLHRASLEILIDHMESSDLCKGAIRTCESCLMKFPDDTSLLKHIGLKKQCLERHNMGLVDPTIVQQLPSSLGGPKAGGCEKVGTGGHSITFHSLQDKNYSSLF